MPRFIPFLSVTLFLLLTGVLMARQSSEQNLATGKVQIAASFYPLAHFASQVGGEYVTVTTLTPPGGEPHEYEPSARDIAQVQASDLVLINGAGLDPWLEQLAPELRAQKGTVVILSEVVDLKPALADDHEEGESAENALDPHFWLDPTEASKEVMAIRNALIEIDPTNQQAYEHNASRYLSELANLHATYEQSLASCTVREVVTGHSAFQYLAKRYNFTIHAISGLSTENEPSPRKLAELADTIQEHNLQYVLLEELANPRFAETLARETGAQTLVLNPIEGLTTAQTRETYLSLMQKNLSTLTTALSCR